MDKIERAVDDIRRKWAPDGRLAVFEVSIAPNEGAQHAAPLMTGLTSSRDARDALRRLAGDAGLAEKVELIPRAGGVVAPAAVVTAALAPLLGEPRVSAPRASEVLHGEILDVLEARDEWLRVRAPDGYIAWVNAGYVATGPADWAEDWAERATARSLSADILTTDGRRRLPTGARVALRRGVVELADGQRGAVAAGNVRREQELRVEARHLALPELAQKWYAGAPYLWGGRTEWGIDCSGLVQAVYAARGVKLPRDSDQQFAQGQEVAIATDGAGYEAGDLLFFAERGRVSHVALWAGAGRIVHSALSRGGVGSDHLFGDEPRMLRMRDNLVGVRRRRRTTSVGARHVVPLHISIMRLILFDIDGTLLWTAGAGRRAIHRALLDEVGTAGPIDGYRFDGKTDPQIVRELLELAGHPDASSDDRVTAVCRRYVELLTAELEKPTQTTKVYPGITELLSALEPYEADGRALVGLLTGNVQHGAALKLRSAGLDPARFVVGAFGSDSHHRPDLPAVAAQRAAQRTGRPFTGADIVIVGDTPDDVACCKPMGARSVGVATGFYDVPALRAAGATHVFADLGDTKAVLQALFS